MRWERAGVLIGLMILGHFAIPVAADDGATKSARATKEADGAVAAKVKSATDEEPERFYPSLPGAVRELPEWVQKNAGAAVESGMSDAGHRQGKLGLHPGRKC